MKALRIILLASVVALFTSCGLLSSASSSTPAANQSTGTSIGAALLALYTQYKTDGKLDLTNLSNILNIATIATSIKGVNGIQDNSGFLTGLMSGSNSLVTNANSSNVMSNLIKLGNVNLSSITRAADAISSGAESEQAVAKINEASANVNTAVTALTSIFNSFKK